MENQIKLKKSYCFNFNKEHINQIKEKYEVPLNRVLNHVIRELANMPKEMETANNLNKAKLA